jgi:hypothetical protein
LAQSQKRLSKLEETKLKFRGKEQSIYGVIAAVIVTVILIYSAYSGNIWWHDDLVTDWITAIGVPFSILISAYTIYRTRRSEKHQGLIDIFKLLDDNAHRNARRRIYNLYGETIPERRKKILLTMGFKKEELGRVDTIEIESKETVKADFNQIGYMVQNDAISKNDFLRVYWSEVLKCWKVLCTDINSTRANLKDPKYMSGFQQLQDYALNYMDKNKMMSADNPRDVYVGPSVVNSARANISPNRDAIEAVFDLPMDKSSVEDANFVFLTDPSNIKVKCDPQYNDDNKTLRLEINLNNLLASGTTELKLVIKKEVKDKGGNEMLNDHEEMIPIR